MSTVFTERDSSTECQERKIEAHQSEAASLCLHHDRGLAVADFLSAKRIGMALFNQFMLAAAAAKASDVTLQSDAQPRIEIDGRLYRLDHRPWSVTEIEDILNCSYGAPSGVAEIRGKKSLDYAYEIPLPSKKRRRFRVNATGIRKSNDHGIELTFRIMPDNPPHWREMGLTEEEINLMTPRSGLVILAGATGSGKSTTIAALTRYHLQNVSQPVKIIDIQAPIEFTFEDFSSQSRLAPSVIGQSEIGKHLPNFASAIRCALRRNPHIIVLGEARDRETIATVFEAALTGHLVYTTVHAGGVEECVHRLLSPFSSSEREHRASDLAACLRFVMAQQLIERHQHQGRVSIREWMAFRRSDGILTAPQDQWSSRIQAKMRTSQSGVQSFEQSVEKCVDEGLISRETAASWHHRQR